MTVIHVRSSENVQTQQWWRNMYEEVVAWVSANHTKYKVKGFEGMVLIEGIELYLKEFYPSATLIRTGGYYSIEFNDDSHASEFCLKFM